MSEELLRESLVALSDARAREALALRHSNAIVESLEAIAEATSPDEALDALLASARRTIGCDVVALLIGEADGSARVDRSTAPVLQGVLLQPGPGFLAKPRRLIDPAARIRCSGGLPDTLSGMVLTAPIRIAGRAQMALLCGNRPGRPFDARDGALLGRLAGLAAQPLTAAELDERNLLLAAVIAGSDASFTIADARQPDLPLIYANEAFLRLSGYELHEVLGRNCRFLNAEPEDSGTRIRVREHVQSFRGGSFEIRNRRKDGTEFLNLLSLHSVPDRSGAIRYVVATQTDVTAIRAAQRERDAERERLISALKFAKSGFLIVNADGSIATVNDGWSRFFPAANPDWAIGQSFQACWRSHLERQGLAPVDAAELAEARFARMLKGSEPEERRGADGKVGLVAERPLADGGAIATIVDITAQKATEERLADQLRALEVCQDGIAIADPDGCFSYMNQAHAAMFGYADGSELYGQNWTILYAPEDAEHLKTYAFPVLMREGQWRGELTGRSRDGSPVAQEVSLSLRANGGLVCVTRDISARLDAEREQARLLEQLQAAQRQEAIGQLATGIAHDFNNVLAAIAGSASILRDVADTAQLSHVARIQAAAGTAASLVEKMLSLGARRPRPEAVDLCQIVTEACELLSASLPARNRLDIDLPARPLVAQADRTELTQVILNLGINARDALWPSGGRIEIGLRPLVDADRACPVDVGTMPSGPGAVLMVRDDGCGIAAEDLAQIFQPFFSRKGDQGSGIGLAVVANILKAGGGGLAIRSEPGAGTEFLVFLPLDGSDSWADSAPTVQAPARPLVQAETSLLKGLAVLVVDDNLHVLEMLTGLLEHVGAEPGPSLSPSDALQAFSADPTGWDLLVTDYDMPEFNGAELARSVRRIRPDLPILLCTALPEAHRQSAAGLFDAVVGKPVAMESFLSAAGAALAARTPRSS